MKKWVTFGALGWLCMAGIIGGAAACSDSEAPGGVGAESGAAGESASGGTNANGGSMPNGGTNATAGKNSYGGDGATNGNAGEGGTAWGTEGGAAGADGVTVEPAVAGAGGDAPCVPAAPALPADVPALVAAPEGAMLVRHLHAVGTQSYRCSQNPGAAPTYSWAFVAPIADLLNSCGVKVGSHFAVPGTAPPVPSWLYEVDGSSVNGVRVESSPADGAIPELLLEQVAHGGDGVFSDVSFVQRLDTVGGVAPTESACDAAHVNLVQEVAYTAEYYFYIGGD